SPRMITAGSHPHRHIVRPLGSRRCDKTVTAVLRPSLTVSRVAIRTCLAHPPITLQVATHSVGANHPSRGGRGDTEDSSVVCAGNRGVRLPARTFVSFPSHEILVLLRRHCVREKALNVGLLVDLLISENAVAPLDARRHSVDPTLLIASRVRHEL